MSMETTYFDWAALATPPAAIAATLLIVQYIKAPLDRLRKVPTRAVVLVIAVAIVLGAQAFTEGLRWDTLPLAILNGFVVALAAMGAYEAIPGPSQPDN